jgi:hypothetical protein
LPCLSLPYFSYKNRGRESRKKGRVEERVENRKKKSKK